MRGPRAASVVALVAAAALGLAACGGGGGGEGVAGVFAGCDQNPNTCNSVPPDQLRQGGQITFALEKNIDNFFLLSSEGNVFPPSAAITPMLPYVYRTQPDLTLALNEDLMVSAEQTSTDPQTVVYKIRPEARWADGTPIGADDFIFTWRYLNGRDCPQCLPSSTAGYEELASVEGSDGGKTVTATFETPYTDWRNLWSTGTPLYPAHIAAQAGDLTTPEGLKAAEEALGSTVPTWSGGPYRIESWQNNVALTIVPNAAWYGAVTPKLDRVVFRVLTDTTQAPIALQNNEVQIIYPQPQVDLVAQVAAIPGVSQTQSLGLTWEHFDVNLANPFLAPGSGDALRTALFTAVDRQDMIDKTVGQFNPDVTPLGSNVLLPQQDGYEDVYSGLGLGSGDVEAAKRLLTEAGYTGVGTALVTPDGQAVPPLRIRYTVGNAIRQNQVELFAASARQLGVQMQVQSLDDLGGTLTGRDFDVIVYAFLASPFPFGNAQQNLVTGGGANYAGFSDPRVDRLLNEAATSTDTVAALAKLNEANRIIAEAAFQLPVYQKPTFIAVRDDVGNARDNPTLDGPTYNIEQWGLRAG